jgi:hypothetical protein
MGCPAVHIAAQQQGTAASDAPASVIVEKVIVEIDDPNLGTRWLMRRDPAHPGGPGVVETAICGRESAAGAEAVIRGGERVVVDEDSKVVEARLEAIALGSAAAGKAFQARLKIGGKVVRAVAVGVGRATLAPDVPR